MLDQFNTKLEEDKKYSFILSRESNLAIIGESGSGKSCLATKLIEDYLKVHRSVLVIDFLILEYSDTWKNFESNPLFDCKSGTEDIKFGNCDLLIVEELAFFKDFSLDYQNLIYQNIALHKTKTVVTSQNWYKVPSTIQNNINFFAIMNINCSDVSRLSESTGITEENLLRCCKQKRSRFKLFSNNSKRLLIF